MIDNNGIIDTIYLLLYSSKSISSRVSQKKAVARATAGKYLGIFRSTAAAGEDQKRDDDDPDAVVVVEKIAEAVIHGSSSVMMM